MTQKTNITINIIILATLILTLVGGVSAGTTIINGLDYRLDENLRNDMILQEEVKEIEQEQERQNQEQVKQGNVLIKIQTNVEWIRKDMESKNE